jgi:hypothetical protein
MQLTSALPLNCLRQTPSTAPSTALLPCYIPTLLLTIRLLTPLYTNNFPPLLSNTARNYSSPTDYISPAALYTKNTLNNAYT